MKRQKQTRLDIQYWSPTSLDDFFRCPRGWFLERSERKHITTPALAKGIFCHSKIEELKLNNLRKRTRYKSAEAFGNVIKNDWLRFPGKTNKIRGDAIIWESDEQKYIIGSEINKIGLKHYPFLTEEPAAILFQKSVLIYEAKEHERYTISKRFKYIFKGRAFSGEIDEIRPNHRVRDYKTGIWKFIEKNLEFSFQPTYYLLTFCILCNKEDEFREMMGIKRKEAKYWAGNPNLSAKK